MLKKFMPLFDAGADGSGGGDDGQGQQPEAGKTQNAGGNGGMTQEQVNAIVTERVKRAEEAALKKQFEALGVKDADELKAIIEDKKKADDAAKTELQKLADKAEGAEKKVKDLEAAHATQIAELTTRLLNSEIKQAAARQVADKDGKVTRAAFRPEALEDEVLVLIDRAKIEEKDGKYQGIEDALAELAKAKPYLLADPQSGSQFPRKGTPPQGSGKPPQKDGGEQKPEPKWRF